MQEGACKQNEYGECQQISTGRSTHKCKYTARTTYPLARVDLGLLKTDGRVSLRVQEYAASTTYACIPGLICGRVQDKPYFAYAWLESGGFSSLGTVEGR
jgi:hypothetical protein